MARRLKNTLRFAVRIFWGTLLFSVITLAVLVQLGRALFPVLDDYRSVVEQQLSRQLQVDVGIGSIEALWEGLRPQLHLLDVEVDNQAGGAIFRVRRVDLEINLLATLKDWRLAFRTLTFSGLTATMQQEVGGGWYVQGLGHLSANQFEGDRFSINDPLDVFLFGRRVEMRDTALSFHFRSGLVSDIAIPSIRLDNDANFHRLAAEFSIDKGEQALSLIVEGQGDPRDPAQFDAQGYLALSAFPSEKVLAALGIANDVLLGEEVDGAPANWRDTGQVDLRLWFQGTGAKGIHWRGDLAVKGVPVIPPQGMRWPQSLRTGFDGQWHPEAGWFVDLVDAQLHWPEFAAPPLTARMRGKLGEPTRLQASQVDVGAWHQVIEGAGLLPESLGSVLHQLAPYGRLRNLLLVQKPAEEGHFYLQAHVEQAGVRSWQGVPAIDGIDGYLEATAFDGHVVVSSDDGISLDFPKVYNQPLALRTAQGDVRWNVDTQQRLVTVSSGRLSVSSDDVNAVGQFNLRLPIAPTPGLEPELTLVLGVREGAASLHRLFVPYTVPDGLYQWLDESIQGGSVTDVGFIYHGSLQKDAQLARVIQLTATVAEGELVFDQNWPALTDASAVIVLDDEEFYVANLRGQMTGVRIDNGTVTLETLSGELGRAISLRGDIQGDSGSALNLLKLSPLKDMLGEQLASWNLSGPLSGQLDLLVPLQGDSEGARQLVTLDFVDNTLHMPGLDLHFDELSGHFHYSGVSGVASENLSARLWGETVQAQLTSEWQGPEKQVQLDFAGQVDMAQLQQWAKRPELVFARGLTAIAGKAVVPIGQAAPLQLSASSILKGVRIDLPEPFYKAEDDTRLLQIDVNAHPAVDARAAYLEYDLRLQDQAHLRMRTRGGEMDGAVLALDKKAPAVESGWFGISGALTKVDLPEWKQVLDAYLSETDAAEIDSAGGGAGGGLPVTVALSIEQLQAGSLMFEGLSVSGEREREQWLFGVQSPDVVGRFAVAPGQPLDVRLSRLRVPLLEAKEDAFAQNPEPAGPGGLADIDISGIGPTNFYCDELFIGDRALGKWQFDLRPVSGGIVAYDLKAEMKGTRISGANRIGDGAELVWLRSNLGDVTYFSGRVATGDVGGLLTHLGQERILTSERASFGLALQWQGAPDAIGLNKLLGVIDIDLQRGRFIRGAQVGENPAVKLLGLLNFDTLARRLRLDFSDLNPEGLGYEQVQGRLAFKEGIIEVDKPLQVNSPASHIQFVGDINLQQQTVDAQLVVTFPLTGNLTMAAALTGVLPAAVGVFVVGKLFKEQIDRVSSIRYKIDGNWSSPKVDVQKVFENQTNHQRGRE